MENIQRNSTVMAPAVPVVPPKLSLARPFSPKAARRVSNYRVAVGWLLVGLWFAGLLALAWDIQWHSVVGRDGFWTPPHWMFYGAVTVAGVLCLGLVLTETFLYHRGYPGLNDQNTTRVLYLFRGPNGVILAGFGMVAMLGSAPLDDYWHQIYGIDLAVWTPFHVMLAIGIIMASIGLLYLFASEMNRRESWRPVAAPANRGQAIVSQLRDLLSPARLGLIVTSINLLASFWLLMEPTFIGKLTIGQLRIPSYSLAVAAVPLILVAVVNATRRVGAATLLGVVFLLFRFVTEVFMIWGVNYLAVDQGVTLRRDNDLQVMSTIYPAFLFLAGLVVDGIYWLTRRWRSADRLLPTVLTAVGSSLAAGLLLFLLEKPWLAYNNLMGKSVFTLSGQFQPDYWAALPAVIVIGALAGLVGLAVSVSWRYADR